MDKARSKEEFFAGMHRELREWNPDVPESPDRLDPILKILMQMYSHQLSLIDRRMEMVWQMASNSLIRSLCPESMRWPVPAYTIMHCRPTDPVVDVDPHTKFLYKEKREGGQTFYFSPLVKEKLIAADIKKIILRIDNALVDLSPKTGDELMTTSRPRVGFSPGNTYQVYLAIDHIGTPADFNGTILYLAGMPDVLKQLRWAYWYPGSHSGEFYSDSGFCPGLGASLEDMLSSDDRPLEWGGLRTSTDLFKPLEDNLVKLPEQFTATWQMGPPDRELGALAVQNDINLSTASDKYYWIRIDLPRGGNKANFNSPFEAYFNCFVVVNKNELTLFKHTGGNKLVEVELPENINNILEIVSVVDSSGREYQPRHAAATGGLKRFYSPEERDQRLVLWFDFSSTIDLPPDSITINYSVTAGTDANGIEAGRITELYENHPGITSSVNIIPTRGAIPAKTVEQVLTEVSARLRNRDRSINFNEIAQWGMTFDPRIKNIACSNGVERSSYGVRRCIVVRVGVNDRDFYSDDEITLLRQRLAQFLKARSAVNTHYSVEIIKG
ncbi:MAG: hypothetical protein PHN52_02335 [candidate division Zixibacteria bacterium]|nr:hypothetical protein [candidate division Zixibacteria bacterium]